MRILIVNTSENAGGAAVAANRLMQALNHNGVSAQMLVRDKVTDNSSVIRLGCGWLQRWRFLWERLVIYVCCLFSRKHLFEIDIACAGADITSLKEFKEADIIHLHWINQGMLSLTDIRKILDSGKPVVWTMHDIWAATAICHYTRDCNRYKSQCHNCKLLPGGGGHNDLAYKVWNRKKWMLDSGNIFFVTCSRWLEKEAKRSALLKGHYITNIPNAIDTNVFCPTNKEEARMYFGLPTDKYVILFVSQRVTDERKGMAYFIEAIERLVAKEPLLCEKTVIALMGGHAEDVASKLPLPVFPLGYLSKPQEIAMVYGTADVFVLPSLEDNLPNTIMEAMSCGVPCVAFNVGGIPEMIDHKKTGYLAEYRSADDLAIGIHWVLNDGEDAQLRAQCLDKVSKAYSQSSVARKYMEVYNQALALSNYKL